MSFTLRSSGSSLIAATRGGSDRGVPVGTPAGTTTNTTITTMLQPQQHRRRVHRSFAVAQAQAYSRSCSSKEVGITDALCCRMYDQGVMSPTTR